MTDESIVALIRQPQRQEEGLRELVMKYQQRLYQVVRRQVSCHEDADDVLQNTFLKVFRHIHSFEGRSELYTWMYRIACNEVINHRKANRKARVVELEETNTHVAESYMDAASLNQRLETAISKLPERQQTVFRMRYFDELPYKNISEILNVTEGALKASFHHAVKKIEEEFRAKQIL
jgi:RNA polymerase sigma-70 factor (ECF subfamily)